MNIVRDSLASARSARWMGHVAGLLAYQALAWLGVGGPMAWFAGVLMAGALLALELGFSLFDRKSRRLKALADGAFPFKKMPAEERAFLQDALGSLPARGWQRSLAAWTLAGALLGFWQVSWAGVALILCSGAAVAAWTQALVNAVMLKRVLPFFYFEGQDGYAAGLAGWLPPLRRRLLGLAWAPLGIALAPPLLLAAFGQAAGLGVLLLQAAIGAACGLAARSALLDLQEAPLEDLASALGRLGQGDLDALLDITDGGALSRATEAFNRSLRAVDRRLFMLEKFGHAVPPGRGEGVLEGLKLDGELRPVALLGLRWLGMEAALRERDPRRRLAALTRFYEAAQGAVDRHLGCTFQMDDGALLAVWGAPFSGEGAVPGALGAAWDLQALLPVLARQCSLREGLSLDWSLALSSGQAAVGLAGPRGRERYSVHGGPLDELRRLNQRSGGAWLDERSAAAALAPFSVQVGADGIRLVGGPTGAVPDAIALGFSPGGRL